MITNVPRIENRTDLPPPVGRSGNGETTNVERLSSRHAPSRDWRTIPKEQQKKRGAPSYFAGAPLKLLFQHLQGYIDSHGNREQFWAKFNAEWHKRYPPDLTSEEKKEVNRIVEKYKLRAGRSKEGGVLNVNDEGVGAGVSAGVGAGVDEDVDGDNTERPLLPLPPNYPPVPYLPLPPNYPPVPYPPIDASNAIKLVLLA
ncbi:hypothetical protein K435DRAFT_875759 [Dendrothele bispora CBS 962.96]|uniref:Uncharacterized protein n=1 Tax=Dendrothele bispora (strain CBS 962.96) TaxID=1314807 RepID=A0A4S8KTQ3_DENBC|nr:hypothetical protein K435DRAFT_875759 [Dendrothele bispora CBS 962.96]